MMACAARPRACVVAATGLNTEKSRETASARVGRISQGSFSILGPPSGARDVSRRARRDLRTAARLTLRVDLSHDRSPGSLASAGYAFRNFAPRTREKNAAFPTGISSAIGVFGEK